MKNSITAEEWNEKGIALAELGKYEEALEACNKATEIDPQYAEAWNIKGIALCNLGRHEEALDAYNRAIELDKYDALSWYNKGVALDKLGRYEEALEAFNKAKRLDWEVVPDWSKPDELPQVFKEAYEMNPQVVMFGTDRKAAFWGRMTGESTFLGIMLAAAVLIWGWAMGFSISSVELQRPILYGGIGGITIGLILSLWSYKNMSVYPVIILLRIFCAIAIVIGLVVWLIRTVTSC